MTRTAMPQFDSFDPEVLEAARDVAARAGVPLETWIASVVPQQGVQGQRRPRRRRAEPPLRGEARSEVVKDGLYEDRREHRRDAEPAPRREAQPEPVPAASHGPGFAALIDRLDGLDRALDAERRAAQKAEGRRLAEIEARIASAIKDGPVQEVTERLVDIERRMSQLGEQVASARPPGRRGRAAAAEIRDAVQEIRQRQRELSQDEAAPSDGDVVGNMRLDLARRLEAQTEAGAAPSAALSALQREAARLRRAIDTLATDRDLGTLEQALAALAANVERAQPGTDLTAIAAPVAQLCAQVERLAEGVAPDAYDRLTDEVRQLAERLQGAAASDGAGADRQALTVLFSAFEEIRGRLGALSAPERVQGLAQRLQALRAQVLRTGTGSGLRPLLDEVRADATAAEPAVLVEQIRSLAGTVETLSPRAGAPGAGPAGDTTADTSSIHAMLRSLAEKVDRVGSRPAGEGLDALERQILALAGRLDTPRGADPALAGLERSMGDLMEQVAALREAGPSEAAVERAARTAVAQTLKGAGLAAADLGEIGLLRASLADMQARQAASDERLGTTLEGVQSALDRLASRMAPAESARKPTLDERLKATTSPEAHAGIRPGVPREPVLDVSRVADGLLEPGAGRPPREPRVREPAARRAPRDRTPEASREPVRNQPAPEAGVEGDIKTSFIAAARRAAQAAQAELAAEAPAERRETYARRSAPARAESQNRLGRLRAEIDRRRRPLLLGLAAIVLAFGALQAIGMRSAEEAPPPAPVVQAAPAAPQPRDEAKAAQPPREEAAKEAARPAGPVPDPQTTQALPNPLPAAARAGAAKGTVPQVAGMTALSADLGTLPPGLAKLKQAALDGDGTAVWETAMREADGRGMPRDLATAAKLYEKLAGAGYAPAQYKLAGHYEKGSGVVRDLDKAKLWYGRAAEQGHARSMHNLAVIYAENPAANGKPDFASAASWFRQGAEFGIRDSQYNLAVLYARGLGLTQDLVQSYAWFAAAAAQGDDDAAKKRDDVANKLSPADLASAKSLAATFKPRKLDAAVNEPPAPKEPVTAPMSLLGAPTPNATGFTAPARKTM